MAAPPTGTVAFLFTDIEGSTGLLQTLGETYRSGQDRHDEIIRAAITAEDGHVVRTAGDSFFVTTTSPAPAVRAVVAAQRRFEANDWPAGSHLRVRMGLHTGQGVPRRGRLHRHRRQPGRTYRRRGGVLRERPETGMAVMQVLARRLAEREKSAT